VLLNPRTPALYSAVLPLFLREGTAWSVPVQLALIGLATASVFLAVDLAVVAVMHRLGTRLAAGPTVRRIVRYAGSSAFALFGLRLLLGRD
jgi:threonine/homoserine/homoserine lactone efflux protein